MSKSKKHSAPEAPGSSASILLAAERLLGVAKGTWSPNVDLCETPDAVTVRVELPGVDASDINLTLKSGVLRIQGIKREPAASEKLLCYYCVERGYGRFESEVRIDWVVDARRTATTLQNGVLTIQLPKIAERRGEIMEITVVREQK